jgi:hypothetical protein
MANMRHDMLRVRVLEALGRKSAGNGCIKAIEGRFVEGMMWTRRWFCYRFAIGLFATTDIFIGGRTERKGGSEGVFSQLFATRCCISGSFTLYT